jgi:hypothetical protein
MNKPTVTKFFLVLIILIIAYLILNFAASYFHTENLIKNQIVFLIIIATGGYAWQKLGVQTCMSSSQKITLIAALFIMTDILLYLLHVNNFLAIIVPLIIYLIGIQILKKRGYVKTKCEINKNESVDIRNDLTTRILRYVVLFQMILSIPLFIFLCGSFLFDLTVHLFSGFVLFAFFLSVNVFNIAGILCFIKKRNDLYFVCVVGIVLSVFLIYIEFQNNFA